MLQMLYSLLQGMTIEGTMITGLRIAYFQSHSYENPDATVLNSWMIYFVTNWRLLAFVLRPLSCLLQINGLHRYVRNFTFPLCSAAAVASDLRAAPWKTPWFQSSASDTRGTPSGRRPPKRTASTLTPFGSSQFSSRMGQLEAGAQNLELGWAALRPLSGVQSWPSQSIRWEGAS